MWVIEAQGGAGTGSGAGPAEPVCGGLTWPYAELPLVVFFGLAVAMMVDPAIHLGLARPPRAGLW